MLTCHTDTSARSPNRCLSERPRQQRHSLRASRAHPVETQAASAAGVRRGHALSVCPNMQQANADATALLAFLAGRSGAPGSPSRCEAGAAPPADETTASELEAGDTLLPGRPAPCGCPRCGAFDPAARVLTPGCPVAAWRPRPRGREGPRGGPEKLSPQSDVARLPAPRYRSVRFRHQVLLLQQLQRQAAAVLLQGVWARRQPG
jgi:hypothetical protein